jgi:hypothetical protein
MLLAVGNAQANHLNRGTRFAETESRAVSANQQGGRWVLHFDRDVARRGRGPRVSWVFRRLNELSTADAEVSPVLRRYATPSRRAEGVTRPVPEAYYIPGAGYFRLPGPYRSVDLAIGTRHARTRARRSDLDIGRTLVHELVIHAWRDVFFYQPRPWSQDPPPSRGSGSAHRDHAHTTGAATDGMQHNYPDAEADLLDHYYDLERGHDLEWAEARHTGFSRAVGLLGGVMGSNVPSFPQYRPPTEQYVQERAVFLRQARAFAEQRRRMEELERRASR